MAAPFSHQSVDQRILNERIRPGDPALNYCLWPYQPPTVPDGKLRASSLLLKAIQEMPAADWLLQTVDIIQAGLGDFRSVYGIKQIDGRWSLEVYLYDYERENRAVSIERLNAACAGQISLPATVGSHVPYFMFSFDLDARVAQANGRIEVVHVYIGNPGSMVSSGISYGFTRDPDATELENLYFFFAADNRAEIHDKVTCAACLNDPQTLLATVLPEQLMTCHTICLANKRFSNTAYFSGINLQQLIWFLQWQQYSKSFCRFIDDHAHELDHLLYDVGVDYQVRDQQIRFTKSGVYGVF
ncbi:MAG: hypothetical protein R3C49_19380 [Planctomycetaceae bacterium]